MKHSENKNQANGQEIFFYQVLLGGELKLTTNDLDQAVAEYMRLLYTIKDEYLWLHLSMISSQTWTPIMTWMYSKTQKKFLEALPPRYEPIKDQV